MINAYQAITTYQQDEWEEYLEKIMLIDIFMPLLKAYQDKSTFKVAVRYILYAYSIDSDKIILGMDWGDNKKKIFEEVYAQPVRDLMNDLVYLKSEAVVETINKWLDFQDSETFRMLQTLRDLRLEMQVSCLSPIKKSSGEVDYTQKYLNAEYAMKLKDQIRNLEQELIQKNPKMQAQVKEIRSAASKFSMGPEIISR